MRPTDGCGQRLYELLEREWLITNHRGGYASSTIPGLNTRKYHGLLVAAMTPPVRRLVLLSRVEEIIRCNGWPTALACNEYPDTIHPRGHESLAAFSHEPFPRWAYQGDGWTLEKSLQIIRGENTVVLAYTQIGAKSPVDFELRPLFALPPMHDLIYQWPGQLGAQYTSDARHHRIPPTNRTPEVFFAHDGEFASVGQWYFNTIYRREQDRGYSSLEDLWSPGVVKWKLSPGESIHFACSADPIDLPKTIASAERECLQLDAPLVDLPARDTDHDLLVRAAEAFAIDVPADSKHQAMPLMTKWPWAAPSVRESLIAMPGLLMVTGKFDAAKAMLLALASRLRNGLLPTEFAENATDCAYSGADTSLWFVHAAWQYLRYTGDDTTVRKLLDPIQQIIRSYQKGTDLAIQTDPAGLLMTRSAHLGTTWMGAKTGDHVVTPRAGRPIELNALWYNAVSIASELSKRFGQTTQAKSLELQAAKISAAFNARFWNAETRCCFDVVDDVGSDASIRPNQLLAISLPFPVLAVEHHIPALEKLRRELLTPAGLRTLSPKDPAYHGRYVGDVTSRDRALHQGCVHPWLLGQFITAQSRAFGRGENVRAESRRLLTGCLHHMRHAGLGQLCELFDGDAPHRPGGAIACATAVGELLRCYVEDILDLHPTHDLADEAKPQLVVTIPKIATKAQ